MKRLTPMFVFCCLLFGFSGFDAIAQETPAALNFTMKSIEGKDVPLSKYAGKVVVFVNVASKCGYTPQYKKLQQLHEKYGDQGLAIIGVPCNQFLGQEPGTDEEILTFCQKNYGVEFDLMSKVKVKGKDQAKLFEYLTEQELAPVGKGPVKWNFEKFVLDRTGQPIARFNSAVSPDSKKFVSLIEKALEEKSPETTSSKAEAKTQAKSDSASTDRPYRHVSQKLNAPFYLFSKQVPLKNSESVSTIYFFSKQPTSDTGTPVLGLPDGKIVKETKTGMLVLKNTASKAD